MASREEEYRPWNFSWVVGDSLCACACPEYNPQITWLKNHGVKTIITLSEEDQPHRSARFHMDCHLITVEEFRPPSLQQIHQFLDICDEAIAQKKPVCVHCRMGLGRTGVMLACYLVKHQHQTAEEAIHNLRLMRPFSIETWSQEEIVEKYFSVLHRDCKCKTCNGGGVSTVTGLEPSNFSWVVEGALCACAWPKSSKEIIWLENQGVKTLVSLSEERQPPRTASMHVDCHLIAVEEFEPPTMQQIDQFINICNKSLVENKVVCVHCRMGLGRTGVMLACYLVKHRHYTAEEAIRNVRILRPYSIETKSQEQAVIDYNDSLQVKTKTRK